PALATGNRSRRRTATPLAGCRVPPPPPRNPPPLLFPPPAGAGFGRASPGGNPMVLSFYDFPPLSRNNSNLIFKNPHYFTMIYLIKYFLDLHDSMIISLNHSTFKRP